ncbi:MAG: hypothetical protein P1U81_12410 [Verrucomicrobiales bacterium]|nr:hypothetical protein [Verrucomicrobiales bacterium]
MIFGPTAAAASTALWALTKQTALELRIEPYAIMIEPSGSTFCREQRIELAEEEVRKGMKSRPPGKGLPSRNAAE